MRTRMAALLLVLAVGAAGCGDSEEGPVVGGVTTGTTATADDGRTSTRPSEAARGRGKGCAERGITTPPFREGACVEDGNRIVVANGRSLLRLRTMSVAIRGFSVAEALRRSGQALTPQGAFLEIALEVRNTTGEAQQFAPRQTLLVLDDQRFNEHDVAEQRFHPDALASTRRPPIAPGELRAGVVVYDVPIGEIQRITREGQLLVANFGGSRGSAPREIGQFRIGAG